MTTYIESMHRYITTYIGRLRTAHKHSRNGMAGSFPHLRRAAHVTTYLSSLFPSKYQSVVTALRCVCCRTQVTLLVVLSFLFSGTILVAATARTALEDRILRVNVLPHGWLPPEDFFLLNLCRAVSDVTITSGANVKAEPSLRVCVQGPFAQGLVDWRSSFLGTPETAQSPTPVIITRGDWWSQAPRHAPILLQTPAPLVRFGCSSDRCPAVVI